MSQLIDEMDGWMLLHQTTVAFHYVMDKSRVRARGAGGDVLSSKRRSR